MKYFIKTDGTTVTEWLKGDYTDDVAKKFVEDGYIEINEEDAELVQGDTLLKYEKGKLVVDDTEQTKREHNAVIGKEMDNLLTKLSATDYVVIKIAEGVATEKEYADVLKDRAEWRKRINEMEGELDG